MHLYACNNHWFLTIFEWHILTPSLTYTMLKYTIFLGKTRLHLQVYKESLAIEFPKHKGNYTIFSLYVSSHPFPFLYI